MKALVAYGNTVDDLRLTDIPVPEIGEDEVLVKVRAAGICGSDIHVYHGKHPYTKYPVTQGHEVSGEIVQVGSAVKGLEVGQKVVAITPTATAAKLLAIRRMTAASPSTYASLAQFCD